MSNQIEITEFSDTRHLSRLQCYRRTGSSILRIEATGIIDIETMDLYRPSLCEMAGTDAVWTDVSRALIVWPTDAEILTRKLLGNGVMIVNKEQEHRAKIHCALLAKKNSWRMAFLENEFVEAENWADELSEITCKSKICAANAAAINESAVLRSLSIELRKKCPQDREHSRSLRGAMSDARPYWIVRDERENAMKRPST